MTKLFNNKKEGTFLKFSPKLKHFKDSIQNEQQINFYK